MNYVVHNGYSFNIEEVTLLLHDIVIVTFNWVWITLHLGSDSCCVAGIFIRVFDKLTPSFESVHNWFCWLIH